jgi:hypothetical protein
MHYYSPGQCGRWPIRAWRPGGHGLRPARVLAMSAPLGKFGLTKTEADDLLDWLESNGCRHFELVPTRDDGFTVRWWD